MTELEVKKMARLQRMLDWRLENIESNSYVEAEASALDFAIEIIREYFSNE